MPAIEIRECDLSGIDPSRYEIRAMPGVVVVEMAPVDESVNGILLPDSVQSQMRVDVAKVVAKGERFEGVYHTGKVVSDPCEIEVGDAVVVRWNRGEVYTGFGWGDEPVSPTELRVYGANGGPGCRVAFHRYSYSEGVVAKMETGVPKAIGRNVVVRMGKREEERGGIKLLKGGKRDPVCEVLSVGAQAHGVAVGDKVLCAVNALVPIGDELAVVDIAGVLFAKS